MLTVKGWWAAYGANALTIPLNESTCGLLSSLKVDHYNKGRPQSSLRLGFPDRLVDLPLEGSSSYRIPHGCRIVTKPILNGLHHE